MVKDRKREGEVLEVENKKIKIVNKGRSNIILFSR